MDAACIFSFNDDCMDLKILCMLCMPVLLPPRRVRLQV